jgi:hypothetical protein
MTPKQRVKLRWPSAYNEWVPGWGLWTVFTVSGKMLGHGFHAVEAWRNAWKACQRDLG